MDSYHSLNPFTDGVNWSFLVKAHAGLGGSWSQAYHDTFVERPQPNDAMRFGTLVHTMVLEPDSMNSEFVVAPEGMSKRTKAYKALVETNPDKMVITPDDLRRAGEMKAALMAQEEAKRLLWMTDGANEQVVQEVFKVDGQDVPVRAKVDRQYWDDDGSLVVVDLKTTKNPSKAKFVRSIMDFGYLGQLAFYADMTGAAQAKIVAVQSVAPYQVTVVSFDTEAMQYGRELYKDLLIEYAPKRAQELVNPGPHNWPQCDPVVRFTIDDVPPWHRRKK